MCCANNIYAQTINIDEINYEKIKSSDRSKLKNFFTAAYVLNKRNDLKGFSKNLNSIANLYWTSKNYEQAIKYFNISLEVNEKLKNHNAIAGISNFKGMIYADAKQYDKSIENFKKAMKCYKLRRRRKDMINTYLNMSLSYKNLHDMQKTIECTEAAFKLAQELNNVQKIADCAGILSSYYSELQNTEKAGFYFNIYKAFNKAKDKELKKSLQMLKLKNALSESKNKAKELELQAHQQKLSLQNKIIIEKDSVYEKLSAEYSEKEFLADLYAKTIKQKEEIIRNERKVLQISIAVLVGSILFLLIIFILFSRSRRLNKLLKKNQKKLEASNTLLIKQKEEITQHKEEIEAKSNELSIQNKYVTQQRDKIRKQNTQINDSILYASRIQKAVLKSKELIEHMVSDAFVILMPRDIVSGDFYWLGNVEHKKIIVVADCTGHGVPGAFMSLLGALLLEEIVNNEHIYKPSEILNRLRYKIKHALKQTGKDDEAKDGMDMALISIDSRDNTLEFAGAYNPLFIYRDKNLEVIKGDRMPIGIHARENDFTNHSIKLQKGDRLYMFTDGYPDQIGGANSRKFMSNRFKEMILANAESSMKEQKKEYLTTIKQWMSHKSKEYNEGHEQVDDILFVGIKI